MRFVLLMLVASMPGWAWEFSYSATTAGGGARWNRPVEDLSGLSVIGDNVRYHAQTFVAPTTGTYTIHSQATGNWDNFLVLYAAPFNAASPLLNAIAANDDWPTFGIIGQSHIVQTLTGGVTYRLVTTGYFNGSNGAFTNTISTPTPEPATWVMIGCGVGLVGLRQRYRKSLPVR